MVHLAWHLAQVKHFFVGISEASDAGKVPAGFISVHRTRRRKSPLNCGAGWPWVMDSGAFSTLLLHGTYPRDPQHYAQEIRRWAGNGNLMAAVSEDWMCEPEMLAITGLTIADHQRLTIERYDALVRCDTAGVPIMPVLQGYAASDYLVHLRAYGGRLQHGGWVGVGSLCKRNGSPAAIEDVLLAIHQARPDLLLHGFGVKVTSLGSALVRDLLWSADSMAWSYHARKHGRNGNDIGEAAHYVARVATMPQQMSLFGMPPAGE